jgi:hypothetical protein
MTQQSIFGKNVRDLDPEIWSMAQEAKLGELRHVYHASKRETRFMVFSQICLFWAVLWIVGSILVVLLSPRPISPAWILPGFVIAGSGCYLVFPQKSLALRNVYLWESGFLHEEGQIRQVFRWDQIESIQGRAVNNPQIGFIMFSYKVRRSDGYEVTLKNGILNGIELINIVLEEFVRQMKAQEVRLVPPRNRAFVDFKLDRQGVSDRQGTLSWQDIQELTIEKGTMVILKRETRRSESNDQYISHDDI